MNCTRCNAPLEQGARFCRNCGLPLSSNTPVEPAPAIAPLAPPDVYAYNPLQSPQSVQPLQPTQQQWSDAHYAPTQNVNAPASQARPTPSEFGARNVPSQENQAGQLIYHQGTSTQQKKAARKRRWPMWVLITLGILVVVIVGGWFLVARPILHNYAQDQINSQLTSSINLILPAPPFVNSVNATETLVNNLLALNHSPSDPVQNAVARISPPVFASDGSYTGGVQFSFSLYGFSCSISAIPAVSNGNMIVTHVQVNGILSWIMSPDELTTLLNARLQDVTTHLNRSTTGVTIKNQEIDITLGQAGGLPPIGG